MERTDGARARRIPWLGIGLLLAIVLSIVAFGLFKRKGAGKPPPIPAGTSAVEAGAATRAASAAGL